MIDTFQCAVLVYNIGSSHDEWLGWMQLLAVNTQKNDEDKAKLEIAHKNSYLPSSFMIVPACYINIDLTLSAS